MLDHPYLATAVVRLPFVDASDQAWCKTMATDGYYIFYNRAFCASLSEPELVFVIAHELFHVVFGHCDRRGHRDPDRWNVAADLAVNLILDDAGLSMPEGVLKDRQYRGLRTEQIYDRLPEDRVEQLSHGRTQLESINRSGNAGTGSDEKRGREFWESFDHHLTPGDPRTRALDAVNPMSTEERSQVRRSLAQNIASQWPGDQPGGMQSELKSATQRTVPWEALLAKFFTGLRRNDYRLYPFNKKHIWRSLYLPSMGAPGPERLIVAIDTSGSMSDDILRRVLSEIDSLRSMTECELSIIQFDTTIEKTQHFDPWESSIFEDSRSSRFEIRGRGGTDIRVPFQWVEEDVSHSTLRADAVIIMTDGFGPVPEEPPEMPVLWIVPEGGHTQYPFGHVLVLNA
jgi:predicted metal-dependent peptidase